LGAVPRSGCWRWAILDWLQCGILRRQMEGIRRDFKTLETKTQRSHIGRRNSRGLRKMGGNAKIVMVAPLACNRLGRILQRPQVITHGNNGKQNDDEHGERHTRYQGACSRTRPMLEPEIQTANGYKSPDEIEEWFHSQRRFYTSHDEFSFNSTIKQSTLLAFCETATHQASQLKPSWIDFP